MGFGPEWPKRGGCREEGETSSVFGLRPNPPSPEGKAKYRPLSPQRLHRDLQKTPCGDFAEDCVRSADNSSNPLQPEPPRMQPPSRPHGTPTGVRGESPLLRFPPAAFRRFRRAKAATYSLHPAATKERTTSSSPTRGNFIPSASSAASASARCVTSPSAWCTASARDHSPPSGGQPPPGPPAPPATAHGSARCRTGCG